MIDTICQDFINLPNTMAYSHSTLAYVVLIIHCRVLHKGGVRIIFQVNLIHRKEYEST